jgi:hypothetical protein
METMETYIENGKQFVQGNQDGAWILAVCLQQLARF